MADEPLDTGELMDVQLALERAPRDPAAGLSSEVLQAVRTQLQADLLPVKPLPGAAVLAGGFGIAFVALAIGLILAGSRAGWLRMLPLQREVMGVLFGGAAVLASGSLAWQMIPGALRRWPLWLFLAGTGTALLVSIAVLFPIWPARSVSAAGFIERGWPCSAAEMGIAIPAFALFRVLARRGVSTSRSGLAATLAGIAGLLAVTVWQFQCPQQQAMHLMIWHLGVPGALLIVLVLLWGGVLSRPRSAAPASLQSGRPT